MARHGVLAVVSQLGVKPVVQRLHEVDVGRGVSQFGAILHHARLGEALPIEPLKAALVTNPTFTLRWIGILNEVRHLWWEHMSLKGVGERLLHMTEAEGVDGHLRIGSGLKSLATALAVSHEALNRTVAAIGKDGVVFPGKGFIALVRGQKR